MSADSRQGRFRIEQIKLPAPSLPAGAPVLRFAHLSDLHLRRLRTRHDLLLEAVNEREPDFLFLTGDIISRSQESWEALGHLLERFKCRHGIFACRGNWEVRHGPRAAKLKEMMSTWGTELLINESRTVETASGSVRVAGLDDLARGWPDFEAALHDNAPADYNILLVHAPVAARFVTEQAGVDLVLSGHTHGGQIRFPLLWPLLLPAFRGRFVDGLHRMEWGHVYVNRGFGYVGMPLRFRCPAEVAFFEVEPTGRPN